MMRGRVLADLDPLGVNGRHGRFEVTELLLLLAVKPALTTGLLWWFVVAAVLARHRWSLASVEHCSIKWAGLRKRAKRDLS